MKKLLVIAYYFPPSGGPGVQRVLKHIKYLPEFGWQPVVLTVGDANFPARDESLLEQVPESTIVYRTKIYEPYDLYRLLTGKKPGQAIDVNTIKKADQQLSLKEKLAEWVRATFFIPDARTAWQLTARKAVDRIISEHEINAVYSSSPPYTCSLIARYAKKKHKLHWIAGFRDPWTDFLTTPKRWFLPRMIDRSLERSVFEQADLVECAWEGIIKDALGKYPSLDKSKFLHVPNGFDSADFPDVERKDNSKFTLTYTGSMYGRRNPASLFEAIEGLITEGKLNPEEFRLNFIGRFGEEVHEMFNKASFRNSINIVGYVPHEKSIEYLLKSDSLLLVVDEAKESNEIVPGKVFEYIGVIRPIIAIAPVESAIAGILKKTGSGKVAHQAQIDKIAKIFIDYFTSWKEGKKLFTPHTSEIIKYERREAAKKLAEIADKF